ncbi:tRNA (guanosine(37)-N1)-methyltransferase TrmD [Desulfuromonas sp. AOP6]|uniref:tRNA (guanosine(37)-N1)-methyltransferase TrmD n=1 Tax=Desulfuromonas sp. AOP6 TaxID=1566351 RepID=UPI00127C28B2|nr:tRNA (guanosine(37)-N1)-methyltransferase TrmD [Desulfuromonas sp. AOP6]BCA80547.1 tRNA (guanine-n (1)-)-methyltransferase [Desulfuromonas sp. AOP6]
MRFDVLTLFPGMFESPFAVSILGKAREKRLIQLNAYNLRDWAEGRHKVTDDMPYGGGAGMVMKPEPVFAAIQDLRRQSPESRVVMMTPQGKTFCQPDARELSAQPGLIFVCGRYEGFDERIRSMVDVEYSLGDFVLTGGELPAMVMIDAVARLLPGVLGSSGSADGDSYADGLLEFPHYTRPADFNGMRVPDVLLSGNHEVIARWRRRQQLQRTLVRRPDLLASAPLTDEDRALLESIRQELAERGV